MCMVYVYAVPVDLRVLGFEDGGIEHAEGIVGSMLGVVKRRFDGD